MRESISRKGDTRPSIKRVLWQVSLGNGENAFWVGTTIEWPIRKVQDWTVDICKLRHLYHDLFLGVDICFIIYRHYLPASRNKHGSKNQKTGRKVIKSISLLRLFISAVELKSDGIIITFWAVCNWKLHRRHWKFRRKMKLLSAEVKSMGKFSANISFEVFTPAGILLLIVNFFLKMK